MPHIWGYYRATALLSNSWIPNWFRAVFISSLSFSIPCFPATGDTTHPPPKNDLLSVRSYIFMCFLRFTIEHFVHYSVSTSLRTPVSSSLLSIFDTDGDLLLWVHRFACGFLVIYHGEIPHPLNYFFYLSLTSLGSFLLSSGLFVTARSVICWS